MDVKSQYDSVKQFERFNPVHKRIYEGRYLLSGRDLVVEVGIETLGCHDVILFCSYYYCRRINVIVGCTSLLHHAIPNACHGW